MSQIDRAQEADDEHGQRRAPRHAFPPGPAWAVGADREHRGPSGIGPGEDRPGCGQESDDRGAADVTGGFVRSGGGPVHADD